MNNYDVIIIGAGHAGIEAALASARLGCQTLMLTLKKESIGLMSCNPAIGGVGKGQLVREVDLLGGEMGLAADRCGIQFRQLNASKGQAVRSSRCQADRERYRRYMQNVVCNQPNLTFVANEAVEILVENGQVRGVKTAGAECFEAKAVIVTAGTLWTSLTGGP